MAAKYPNNLIVQVNKPLDEKLVCEKLSDLTEYLYVGLLTYQKLDGKYYYVKSIDGGVPAWEELKTGSTGGGGGEILNDSITTDKIKDSAVTNAKIANNAVTMPKIKDGAVTEDKLSNDAVTTDKIKTGAVTEEKLADEVKNKLYVAPNVNLLKNTNFGDGLSGWTKSGSVTIKNDVYEGIGAAYIDAGGMIGQDVTLDAGVYTLSFRVANGSISRDYPLKVLLRRANVSNVVTNAEGWNNDDIPTIAVISVSDKVYITFTLALASNINIGFENSRYGCLVDSIRLEKGDTASPYDEIIMQKRLVSGLNMATINGQSLLDGGNIVISGSGGGYTPPVGGISRENLSDDVQTSLGKADTALQEGALSDYAKMSDIPTSTSQLTNDSGYVSVIPNLLKNTNFGDGLNGWTTSGTVTIKNDVYEGLGVAEIGGSAKLAQSVRLAEGRYTLSFRVDGEFGTGVLIVKFDGANIANLTTEFYKPSSTSVVVDGPRELATISFTVTSESDMNIEFESTGNVYQIDSIRLDKGDTANAYDEYIIQKRLVSGYITEERVEEMIEEAIVSTINANY